MRGNDELDKHHERERRRLRMTWDAYWRMLAKERVGDKRQQVADVLAQLRDGGYENRIRAETIEALLPKRYRSA